jgi:hypothetical protein
VWWLTAIDAAGVGPAEVAAQPVHHVVVGEAATEVRDDGLDALGVYISCARRYRKTGRSSAIRSLTTSAS